MAEKELKELRTQKKWFDMIMDAKTTNEVREIQKNMPKGMFEKLKKNYYVFCNLEHD